MTELESTSATVTDPAKSVPGASPGDGTAPAHRPSYTFLAVVSVITLALDLGSKLWAERRLERPDPFTRTVDVIKGILDFQLAKNHGGAFGLLADTPEYIRRPFFLLVSGLAITFIVSLYRRLAPAQRALRWGLPLVLGGALGNLTDRIRYAYVIDFIHAHLTWGGRDHSWPTFNVADIAICIGVGLMALDMFGSKAKARAAST
ncbi:MAG TPA: signal peptidase II [Polyangiaceae bacterium]|nr:signal peptidase II [Polyangiaceae bacterium]